MKMFAIIVICTMSSGCVYHIETTEFGEKTHIGFPEFSEGKEITLISFN